jgi:hypothetical protein
MDRRKIKEKWDKIPAILREIATIAAPIILLLIILKITLGSSFLFPGVAVISGSMVHEPGDDSWRAWLNAHGVTDEQISTFPLQDGFERGDMIITMRPTVKLGDVVIYERDSAHNPKNREPIIHRIIGIASIENNSVKVEGTLDCLSNDWVLNYAVKNKIKPENSDNVKIYITKGDHNPVSDQCGNIAFPLTESQLLAKTFIMLPKVGYVTIYKWILIFPILFLLIYLYRFNPD